MTTTRSESRFLNIPTSSIPHVETVHGRMRREQRGITKKDVQRARKYGTREPTHPRPDGSPTAIYTYKDITYIVNEATDEEVTAYAVPLRLDPVLLPSDADEHHELLKARNQRKTSRWTSNTVMVVDVSGSMKQGDVWGSRHRLSAIWLSIALDFLAHRLESCAAKATDVISIITLEEEPRIILKYEPCTWTLYNKVVDIYNGNLIQPKGHGPFIPCLDVAHSLLTRNSSTSCALALLFLSDGKPSDMALERGSTSEDVGGRIVQKVESLAKQFGRRLSFTALGIGDMENFSTLESMVDGAKDYGANAHFANPAKTSAAIGGIFTALSSTLTATQTEMTDMDTLQQHKVKSVIQESRKKASISLTFVDREDFYLYNPKRVIRLVYKEWMENGKRNYTFEPSPLQHPLAKCVALSKGPFGEGGERYAYRFYELAADMRTIVGPALVAKESRLVLDADIGDNSARSKFVKKFCSTQQLARRLANEFNATLSATRRAHRSTPKIAMLDCSVYKIDDHKLGNLSVLVEEKIDDKRWHKWNMNNGYVEGMRESPVLTNEHIARAIEDADLGMIEEGSEEDDSENEPEEGAFTMPGKRESPPVCFTASEVAQAFSHYTFYATGKKRLVCDLQGVFDETANVLRLSDPVIHYRSYSGRRQVHGITDRGESGIGKFLATHREHCGYLCRLVNRRFWRRREPQRRRDPSGQR